MQVYVNLELVYVFAFSALGAAQTFHAPNGG